MVDERETTENQENVAHVSGHVFNESVVEDIKARTNCLKGEKRNCEEASAELRLAQDRPDLSRPEAIRKVSETE